METPRRADEPPRAAGADAPGNPAAAAASVMPEVARAAIDAATTQATAFIADVTEELGTSAEAQKRLGADAMKSFAQAIHKAGEDLDPQSPEAGRRFHEVARGIESLADTVRDATVKELFGKAADLARAWPPVFFAGAAFAGFAVARFIKSSAPAAGNRATPHVNDGGGLRAPSP
jgi:hypothetical protein